MILAGNTDTEIDIGSNSIAGRWGNVDKTSNIKNPVKSDAFQSPVF
jgi:hypothetical protein